MAFLKSFLRASVVSAIGAVTLLATSANGAVTFAFGTDTANASTYTASAANAPVQVPIYLYETRANGDTSLLTTIGLYSAGFSVTRGSNTSGTGIAAIAQSVTRNAAFSGNVSLPTYTAAGTSFEENIGSATTGVMGTSTGSLTTRLFLGTLSLTAGSTAGVTPFSIGDTGLNLRSDTGDPLTVSTGAFSVTSAVPEPAALISLGGLAILLRRRTR